jgi:hypothetical protein
MTTTPQLQGVQTIQLDRTLECAVVLSWDELMPSATSGLIHIEYRTGSDGLIDYLKIWSSTIRGYWQLVCECWMRPLWSHVIGMSFGKDYYSVDLAHMLELVMQHENDFSQIPDRDGLIQVSPPTPEERLAAERWTREMFNQYGSVPMETLLAA